MIPETMSLTYVEKKGFERLLKSIRRFTYKETDTGARKKGSQRKRSINKWKKFL